MNKDSIINIVAKLFGKNISQDENSELIDAIDSDSLNQSMHDAWEASGSVAPQSVHDDIWSAIENVVDKKEAPVMAESVAGSQSVHHGLFVKSMKVAAVALLALMLGSAGYFLTSGYYGATEKRSLEQFRFEVNKGQKAQLWLADGTQVWLNSGSRLSYDANYNDSERVVTLEGEAYFDVAKNPNKRFVVKCGSLEVEALGTRFNVKAYDNDSQITTTLAQGKVRVSDGKSETTLLPKEVARFDVNSETLEKDVVSDLAVADFWRTDKMVFDGESLESICRVVERMYGVNIVFRDPKLKTVHFTGTICNNSLNNVFHIISLTYPINYIISDDTIWVDSQ